MHDENDEIIYVGKAVNLRNRVRQYFTAGKNRGAKIEQMITKVRRFEYIVTDSEIEALVLECNLIKENRPRYNTMLMDDKGYPFIKVTVDEPYPRVMLAHKMQKDKAKYFGPFTNSKAVRDTVELIRKIYHVRSCSRNLPKEIGKGRPCLNYHIGKCMAPCQGYVSEEEYRKSTEGVLRFLGGHYDDVLKSLDNAMKKAADDLEFEKAIEYRDLKNSVSRIEERQKITDSSGGDRDIVAVASDDTDAVVQVFFTRGGRITGREHFFMRNAAGMRKSELLGNFIKQFYSGTPFIPGELMLQEKAEDQTLIEEWLGKKRGKNVRIRVPQKGEKEKLIELARENAGIVLKSDKERLKAEEGRTIGAVKEIEVLLGLKDIVRMESYDISNISGYDSVGSMVVYERGKPKRTDYRKFRIKDVQGPDDYAGMEEMLTRRFSRGLKEREEENEAGGFSKFPDLLLMDGGKGQVNAALKVLKKLGLTIPVCGMVKDDAHRTRGIYYENEEIPVEKDSEGFKLITRIQDETHRFAIEYHRKLRSKEQVHSILDDIKGIGPKRRKALMKSFPGIDALKSASLEDLKKVPSMNEKSAVEVYNFFHA